MRTSKFQAAQQAKTLAAQAKRERIQNQKPLFISQKEANGGTTGFCYRNGIKREDYLDMVKANKIIVSPDGLPRQSSTLPQEVNEAIQRDINKTGKSPESALGEPENYSNRSYVQPGEKPLPGAFYKSAKGDDYKIVSASFGNDVLKAKRDGVRPHPSQLKPPSVRVQKPLEVPPQTEPHRTLEPSTKADTYKRLDFLDSILEELDRAQVVPDGFLNYLEQEVGKTSELLSSVESETEA